VRHWECGVTSVTQFPGHTPMGKNSVTTAHDCALGTLNQEWICKKHPERILISKTDTTFECPATLAVLTKPQDSA
jgi:hypothetical protein